MSDIEKQESESCWKNSWKPLGSLPVSYFFMFSRASGLDVKEMVSKAAITFKIIIIGSSCHPWMTRLRTRNQNSIISEIDSSDKSNDISTLRQITHKKSVVETLKLIALLVIINVAICLHHCSSSFIITNHCWNYCHPPPPPLALEHHLNRAALATALDKSAYIAKLTCKPEDYGRVI